MPGFLAVSEMARINTDRGFHWFKPDTLRFFEGSATGGCEGAPPEYVVLRVA